MISNALLDNSFFLGVFEGHFDPAVALVHAGKTVAYIEEERLRRQKHAYREFPIQAIQFCLSQAGITPEQVTAIAINWDLTSYTNGAIESFFQSLNRRWNVDRNTLRWQQQVLSYFNFESYRNRHESVWRRTFGVDHIPPILSFPHHYVHALQTFLHSPFQSALCLTIDGSGDTDCTVLWICSQDEITPVRRIEIPHSLGWFYAAFTEYLGFRAYDGEYKLMGLASYGKYRSDLDDKIEQILFSADDGIEYQLDPSFIHYGEHTWSDRFTDKLVDLFNRPMRLHHQSLESWHEDLAFAVQNALERAVCRIVGWAMKRYQMDNLCLGGGVALNAKMNARIRQLPEVKSFFSDPLCSDSGAALGAAMAASRQNCQIHPTPLQTLALGNELTQSEIEETFRRCGINVSIEEDVADTVAELLAEGKLVGWFQGRMEAGPRALGQRSILADPRVISVRDRVNEAVKYREKWRPFCPSIPVEYADAYLQNPEDGRFMNVTFTATEKLVRDAPAIVHVDNTVRVQLVHRQVLPLYHRLIMSFGEKTGVPVLLNTSFNIKGEPIVCNLLDAIRTFYSTGLDCLAAGNCIARK